MGLDDDVGFKKKKRLAVILFPPLCVLAVREQKVKFVKRQVQTSTFIKETEVKKP
jgi:hypothetical protein